MKLIYAKELSNKNLEISEEIKRIKKDGFKINDLYYLNMLKSKASILLNHNIDNAFYDNFMFNDINWLFNNYEKIESDYQNNLDKLKFDIILNGVNLPETQYFILSLRENDIEEFSNYVNHIPYEILNTEEKSKINKIFEEFKNQSDDYLALKFFDEVERK